MLNIRLQKDLTLNRLGSIIPTKIDGKKVVRVTMNLLLLFLMVVSVLAPALQIMANQALLDNAQKDQSNNNNNVAKNNQNNALNQKINEKINNMNSKINELNSNSNQNNKNNQQMKTQASTKTITGINSNSQIKMNETFDLNSSSFVNTTNSILNTNSSENFTFNSLSNYKEESGQFNVSNINATPYFDMLDENFTGVGYLSTSSTFRAIAGSFNITQAHVNVSSIAIDYVRGGAAVGSAFIVGVSGGKPNATVYGSTFTLSSTTDGVSFITYNYSSYLTLNKGTYALVLNQTSPTSASTLNNFNYAYNANDQLKSQSWYYGFSAPFNTWTVLNANMLFGIQYTVLDPTNISNTYSYTSPNEINLLYNGTAISNLINNNILITGNIANFTTNTSVTFDINYIIVYSNFTNYLTATTEYFASNSTILNWNVTLFHNSIVNQSYTVNNRIITFYSIPTDWNATDIYYNTSNIWTTQPDGGGSVTYKNQTSILTINASTTLSAYNWTISFVSPNYIKSYSATSGLYGTLIQPFSIYSNDSLQINTNLSGAPNGGNGTFQVYDPYDLSVYYNSSKAVSSDSISFDSWILSSTINTTKNQNGTYIGTVFWISTDLAKIGFFEFNFSVIMETKITGQTIPNTIKGQLANISINYLNWMNNTNINNASVTYITDANWGISGQLIGINHQSYNGSLDTSSATIGYHWIFITATLPGYVTQTINQSLTVVINTALLISYPTTVYYYDVVNISVGFYDLFNSYNISGATITYNSSNPTGFITNTNTSYYLFDTSTLPNPSVTSFHFTINATKTFYKTQSSVIVINLKPAPTTIHHYTSDPTNYTGTDTKYFAFNTRDQYTYKMSFNDSRHNLIIYGATLSSNVTSALSINGTGIKQDYPNGSWVVTINPLKSGTYPVKFTFSKDGYDSVNYIVTFIVSQTPTSATLTGQATYPNGTKYNVGWQQSGGTYNFIFYSGTKDIFTINMTLYDTIYNQNVTESGIVGNLSTIPGYYSLVHNNVSGTWNIAIDPSAPSNFILQYVLYSSAMNSYLNQTITLNIHILDIPTKVEGSTTNGSILTTTYQSSTKDNITLSLTYNDTYWNELIINSNYAFTTNATYSDLIFSNVSYGSTNATWFFYINPDHSGVYILTFTFYQPNYVNYTFVVYINVLKANIQLVKPARSGGGNYSDYSINVDYSNNSLDTVGATFIIQNGAYNTNITSTSIQIVYTGDAILGTAPINLGGNFSFTFDANMTGTYTVIFTLTDPNNNYNSVTITITIIVSPTPTYVSVNSTNSYISSNNTLSVSVTYDPGTRDNLTYMFAFYDYNRSLSLSTLNGMTNDAMMYPNISNSNFTLTSIYDNYANWTVYINPNATGTFILVFTFTKPGYQNMTLIITLIVIQNAFVILNSGGSSWSNSTSYSKSFNQGDLDNVSFAFNIQDNFSIAMPNALPVYSSTSSYNITLINQSNGQWLVMINPLVDGSFTISILIYQIGFVNKTFLFTINIAKSQTVPIYNSPANWGNQTTFAPVYNYTTPAGSEIVLYITSKDSVYGVDIQSLFTNLNLNSPYFQISTTEFSNHTWRIVIVPIAPGDAVFRFTLSNTGYYPFTIQVDLHILMPTKQATYQISGGLIGNITNSTSRLGYIMEVDSNWSIYNNTQAQGYILSIYKNGTLINGTSAGIVFLTGDSNWTSKVLFYLYPDFNYTKGWYEFTLTFTKYGYVNQSITFDVYIEGFNFNINLTYDPQMTQGSTFNVYATITYDNGTAVNTAQLMFFKFASTNANVTYANPVNGLTIDFKISVLYTNEKSGSITGSELTNAKGLATFTLSSKETKNIASIKSITATISNSTTNDLTVNNIVNPVITVQKVNPALNPLFIIGPVIAVIIIFLFGILFFRRRSKKNAKIRAIFRGNMDKLDLMNSVYSIMLTSNTGLPVLTKINAVYSKSKAVEELISGLSVGIDTFLSTFQADFMSKIGTTDQTKVDPNNPHKVYMSAIKRNEFHVLILASPSYRGFVFLKDPPTSFVEQTFFKIVEQIQSKVQIDVVFDEDEVRTAVQRQIALLFPFKLLDKFVLNAERIVEAEKNDVISKPAAEALMRVFAITTGAININETPQKQIAQFNKVLRKNAAFSGASDRMDAIKSGILFYNTCYTMMLNQLKLPVEEVREALWDTNVKNTGIFEPRE